MHLYAELGRKEESRKQAREVVDLLLEGKPTLGHHDTLELLKVFTAAGDLESARRLHKAMAAHADPRANFSALEIEGELVAIQADVEDIVRHLDRALLPRPNDVFQFPHPAAKPFLEALKRERKLDVVAARLLQTPADTERGRFHTKVLSWAVEQMSGSDRTRLLIQVQERMNGKAADPAILLSLLESLTREKKWKETRAMAEALLKRTDLIKDGRAIAEAALAECHEAAGDVDQAVAACIRAVEWSPARAPWIRLIQGRTLLAARRPEAAVELYAAALEERMTAATDTETWSPEMMLLEALRKILAAHRDLLVDVETAARREPGRVGFLTVLAVVEELRGRPRGSVEAFERALALRSSATLLRELFLSCLSAGSLDRALEIHGRLAAIVFARPAKGRTDPPYDLETLDRKMADACVESGDLERCKRFTRALALEPLDRHSREGTIRFLLLDILEEDFLQEIDATLARNARNEWQRFYAHAPLAWIWRELGMGDRGAAIYERMLREQDWSESYRSTGKSWIESLNEKREPLSIEVVRSWLAGSSSGNDESAALSAGARTALRRFDLDLSWKFRVRRRNPETPWLKLGALCGRREERIACLEELIRRGETRPEWIALLGVARLERGEEDRAALAFRNLIRETPEKSRNEAWSILLNHLRGNDWRPADLTAAARVWARAVAAEARLEIADDPAERQAGALELARALLEGREPPLRALIALARGGEGPRSEEIRAERLRIRVPNLFTALKDAGFPPPTGPRAAEIDRLIQGLGSEDFDVRQAAHRRLIGMGESAVPALLPLVDSSNVDLQSHARQILRALVGE